MKQKIDQVLQKDLLYLMLTGKSSIAKFKNTIEPDYFSINAYKFLFKKIVKNYNKHDGELLSKKALLLKLNHVKDEKSRAAFRKKILPIYSRKVESPSVIEEEIYKWAEKQKFGLILEEAAQKSVEGSIEEGKEIIKSSFMFDTIDGSFKEYSYIEEWHSRQKKRKEESKSKKIKVAKIGLNIIDRYVKIKLNRPMMGIIMGTSGVGKSITSINIGTEALSSNLNVAHFVYENTARQTLDRYDSRITQHPYSLITDYNWNKSDLSEANKIMRLLRRKRAECLKIFHAPIDTVGIADVEATLKEAEIKTGWEPNVIIYDSPDHMTPSIKQESYRLNVKKVYSDVKWQTEKRNIPIFGTVHAKSSAKGTKVTQEDSAESYDKARLSDLVMTISQTTEQEDDLQAEFWIDKWRDGPRKIGVLVDLMFKIMTLREIEKIEQD